MQRLLALHRFVVETDRDTGLEGVPGRAVERPEFRSQDFSLGQFHGPCREDVAVEEAQTPPIQTNLALGLAHRQVGELGQELRERRQVRLQAPEVSRRRSQHLMQLPAEVLDLFLGYALTAQRKPFRKTRRVFAVDVLGDAHPVLLAHLEHVRRIEEQGEPADERFVQCLSAGIGHGIHGRPDPFDARFKAHDLATANEF